MFLFDILLGKFKTAETGAPSSAKSNINQPLPNNAFTPILLQVTDFDELGMHDLTVQQSGTATGTQTATTLQDTSKVWTVDQFKNMVVTITGGTGVGQVRLITANSVDTLTVGTWTTTPDATSTYQVLISNRLTIKEPGKYYIKPRLTFSGNATGLRGIAIYKGTTFVHSTFQLPVGAVESMVPYPGFYLECVAGDWIEMRGYQTSGGVLNTLGSASNKVLLQVQRAFR